MWIEHMKMLMTSIGSTWPTQESQEFLIKQMDDYFFGEGSALRRTCRPESEIIQRITGSRSAI